MEVRAADTEETKRLAGEIAEKIKPGDVLALYGDLGSGKTTFVKYLAEALNSASRVQSPTFVLHRRYKADRRRIKIINHLDLYRIQSTEDTNDLGLQEIFSTDEGIAIIEWPEVIERFLPGDTIKIYFRVGGENLRLINVQNIN